MALKVGELFASINLDNSGFNGGLTKSENILSSFGKKLAAIGAGAALVKAGKEALQLAIDYESAFAGVRKTTDATEAEYAQLSKSIIDMSKEIPATAVEIAAVAEAAGQLGIEKDSLLDFTRVMIDLGESTNLSSDEAATALARFANITGMSADDYSRLGSVIVGLGNNFATTESEIVDMATGLAGAGSQVGISEAQIMGIAAALSSVGIEAEAGSSTMSTLLSKISLAKSKGGKPLKQFAKVAGMTSKEFSKAFEEDAAGALMAFVDGLGKAEDPLKTLESMGLSDIRMQKMLLALAGASDTLRESLELSGEEWEKNNALTEEAEKRYATTASRIQVMKNNLSEVGRRLGEAMLPIAEKVVGAVTAGAGALLDWFDDPAWEETRKKIQEKAQGLADAFNAGMEAGGVTTGLAAALEYVQANFNFDGILGKLKRSVLVFRVKSRMWLSKVDWDSVWSALWTGIGNVGKWLGEKTLSLTALIGKLADGVKAWADSDDPFSESPVEFSGFWSGLWKTLTDVAMWLPEASFEAGVLLGKIASALTGLGGMVVGEIKKALQPEEGQALTVDGALESVGMTTTFFDDMAKGIVSGIQTALTGQPVDPNAFDNVFQQLTVSLSAGLEKFYAWIAESLDGIWPRIETWFKRKINDLVRGINLFGWTPQIPFPEFEFEQSDINKKVTELDHLMQMLRGDWGEDIYEFGPSGHVTDWLSGLEEADYSAISADIGRLFDEINSGTLNESQLQMATDQLNAYLSLAEELSKYEVGDEVVDTVITSVLAEIDTLPDEARIIGQNIDNSLESSIRAGKPDVVKAMKELAQAVVDAANKTLEIGSPSKVMRKYGSFTSKGLALGLTDQLRYVSKSAYSVARAASDALMSAPATGFRTLAAQGAGGYGAYYAPIDYDRLAEAQSRRRTVLVINDRELAEVQASENAVAITSRATAIKRGYGS